MIRNLSDSEFVTPTTSTASFLTPNSPSQLLTTAANDLSRSSSMTYVDERLEFQVAHFFIFGSPLGLVLAYRKIGNNQRNSLDKLVSFFVENFRKIIFVFFS